METREIISKNYPLERDSSVYYYQINKNKETSKNKTCVICLHDINSHHESFNPLIKSLVDENENYEFISIDLLGHGLSNGTRGQIGDFSKISNHLDSIIRQEHDENIEYILLGDGIGASLILGYLQVQERFLKEKLKGCIIINPTFTFGFEMPSWAKFLYDKLSNNIENIRIPLSQVNQFVFGTDELKHLPEDDPLILKTISLKVLFDLEQHISKLRGSHYFLDIPMFFLLSRNENSKNLVKIEQFYKGIPSNKKQLEYYLSTNFYNGSTLNKISLDIHTWIKKTI